MRCRHSPASIVLATAFGLGIALPLVAASAQDAPRLPDWKGQWIRTGAGSFDPGKPPGLRQDAPLTPEYQAILEASIAAQAPAAQGNDPMAPSIPPPIPPMLAYSALR